jgi:predicted CopG family antitoxin
MAKKRKETITIVLDKSVYTQLKGLKIIPEESFNSVIKRILSSQQPKEVQKMDKTDNPAPEQGSQG